MYKIERKFQFPAGHRLSKHKGGCFNLHGHNYLIYIGLKSSTLDDNDMIIDFSVLKDIAGNYFNRFDHCFIINKNDSDWINPVVKKMGFKTEILDDDGRDPTAEVMSEKFYKYIQDIFNRMYHEGQIINLIKVDYVKVYETENSNATYSEE